VVLVNTDEKPQKVRLRPEQDLAGRDVRHYFLDGRAETANSLREMDLDLAAYDVQIVAFESQ